MRKIQQVIVVEGRHDTQRLKRWFDCDTIETGGLSLSDETIELIRNVQKDRGIIIFTDPDSPGNRIRNRILQEVPGCLQAFVDKTNARTTRKVGIEHAGKEALEAALDHLVCYTNNEEITMQDMYELGLSGHPNSSALREALGRRLHIGNGNAKTMRSRINCLGLSYEQIKELVDE